MGYQTSDVGSAAYDLFKARPELLDLPVETLAAWLQSENKWERLGAIRAAALDPKLARVHARTLSELLGDEAPDVRDAAQSLLRARPELLNLPTEPLVAWLQSKDVAKRLGAIRAVALDPKLAHFHTRLLSERLGDDDPEIRDAAQGLFETHPGLLDSSSIAWGLLSPDSDYRQRILNLVHPLDTSNLSALMPLLEACHRNNEHCDELRLAAHLTGGGGSEWEDLLRWLGRPKPEEVESCLKEIRNDDQAARHTLKMFANTWEAMSGFPNTRKELADRIRSLVDTAGASGTPRTNRGWKS